MSIIIPNIGIVLASSSSLNFYSYINHKKISRILKKDKLNYVIGLMLVFCYMRNLSDNR